MRISFVMIRVLISNILGMPKSLLDPLRLNLGVPKSWWKHGPQKRRRLPQNSIYSFSKRRRGQYNRDLTNPESCSGERNGNAEKASRKRLHRVFALPWKHP